MRDAERVIIFKKSAKRRSRHEQAGVGSGLMAFGNTCMLVFQGAKRGGNNRIAL